VNEILAKKYICSCALVLAMIIASLYFNILALQTPFLTIYNFIMPNKVYSLFGAVELVWGHKAYAIAILIVGFSIIFPFVKLFFLFIICFVIKGAKARHRTIIIIEALAKWSMLDVFVVCILLVLTNNQLFVSSKPNIGIYYFLLAIFISIICAILVDHLCEKTYPVSSERISARRKFTSEKFTVYEKALIIILLLISATFLIFAVTDNYIQVSGFFLRSHSYSIVQTCLSIGSLSLILAWFIGFVLIIFPFIIFNYFFIFWTTSYHPTFHIKIMKLINKLSQFMMLDVFSLALVLVLLEGNIIIGTKTRNGLYTLVLFVFMSFFIPMLIRFYSEIRYRIYLKRLGLSGKNEINSKQGIIL